MDKASSQGILCLYESTVLWEPIHLALRVCLAEGFLLRQQPPLGAQLGAVRLAAAGQRLFSGFVYCPSQSLLVPETGELWLSC